MLWTIWYRPLWTVTPFSASKTLRIALAAIPLLCFIVLWAVLHHWAADDFRSELEYLWFYFFLGVIWLWVGVFFSRFLGISARDDAVERRNWGACSAVAGTLFGVTFCFAGGNIGNGPGTKAVVFSAALSTGGFFLLWFMLELLSRPSSAELVTVERDLGAGLRLGGWLAAEGLLLGWSVAGDWTSYSATLGDFTRFAWPSLILLAIALLAERIYSLLAESKYKRAWDSAVIAVAYLASAGLYVASQLKRG